MADAVPFFASEGLAFAFFDVEKTVHNLLQMHKNEKLFLKVSTNGKNPFWGKCCLPFEKHTKIVGKIAEIITKNPMVCC